MSAALDDLAVSTPGGPGLAQDIAPAITYLASDDAAFVPGAILTADGGRTAV
jgi:NAD(P)-dependent dehydrogenase (short-subunit alcohol dehydrogenase family)